MSDGLSPLDKVKLGNLAHQRAVARDAALVELLRERGVVLTRELAAETGLARRTIFRMIARLRRRGVPIEASAGLGGGIRLKKERRA